MKKLLMLFIGCLSTTSIYSMDIFEAAQTDNITRIKELIAADPGVVNQQDAIGETPLHLAVSRWNEAIAAILIKNGADIFKQNTNGVAPLGYARAIMRTNISNLMNRTCATRQLEAFLCVGHPRLGAASHAQPVFHAHSEVARILAIYVYKATL